MKAWSGVEKDAKPILDYVKRPIFFDGPYKGVAIGKKLFLMLCRRPSTLLMILEINFRIGRQFWSLLLLLDQICRAASKIKLWRCSIKFMGKITLE